MLSIFQALLGNDRFAGLGSAHAGCRRGRVYGGRGGGVGGARGEREPGLLGELQQQHNLIRRPERGWCRDSEHPRNDARWPERRHALDPAAGKIYWANANNNTIGVANLDGTGGRTLNTTGATLSYPDGLVVDHANGKIYIANYNSSTITYANLDGSGGGGTLDITGASPSGPIGNLALDLSSGRLYWSNFSTGTISYANADGSGGGNVLPTTGATLSGSFGVAIDPALGRIFTANQSNNTLSFANLAAGAEVRSTRPEPRPTGRVAWRSIPSPGGSGGPTSSTGRSPTPM